MRYKRREIAESVARRRLARQGEPLRERRQKRDGMIVVDDDDPLTGRSLLDFRAEMGFQGGYRYGPHVTNV